MSARIILVCDVCHDTSLPFVTVRGARRGSEGWLSTGRGRDYCPKCAEPIKARIKENPRGYF